MFPRWFQRLAAERVQEEEDILRIMTVFPAYYQYKSKPTYEQFVPFAYDAEAAGFSLTALYQVFCSGTIPPELDALIRKHAEHWPPSGETVESRLEQRRLEGPKS